jgi:Domain of unknown function (DUF6484)
MKHASPVKLEENPASSVPDSASLLYPLVAGQTVAPGKDGRFSGIVIGELISMTDKGRFPMVVYPVRSPAAAVQARTTLDLHREHIGARVVLMFEGADPMKPIVLGVLREDGRLPCEPVPGKIDVDADGQRLTVSAKEQLVLRCGDASITLTKSGKILLHGSYVSSHSSGVLRIKGGSVQIN